MIAVHPSGILLLPHFTDEKTTSEKLRRLMQMIWLGSDGADIWTRSGQSPGNNTAHPDTPGRPLWAPCCLASNFGPISRSLPGVWHDLEDRIGPCNMAGIIRLHHGSPEWPHASLWPGSRSGRCSESRSREKWGQNQGTSNHCSPLPVTDAHGIISAASFKHSQREPVKA